MPKIRLQVAGLLVVEALRESPTILEEHVRGLDYQSTLKRYAGNLLTSDGPALFLRARDSWL
jgi:hypothetical protein